MDVRAALKNQYHAALLMLRECVEKCPDEVWISGTFPRNFWRIAYHTAFYADLYLGQTEADFVRRPMHRESAKSLWPEEGVPEVEPYTQAEILSYIDEIRDMVDPTIDTLDLDTLDSGFSWYKNISKLDHEILNIRHIQTHAGQLSELLMAQGIDTSWISRRRS